MSEAQDNGWWPHGETTVERGMRLTGLDRDEYMNVAKYQAIPFPPLTKDERFDYFALCGKPPYEEDPVRVSEMVSQARKAQAEWVASLRPRPRQKRRRWPFRGVR